MTADEVIAFLNDWKADDPSHREYNIHRLISGRYRVSMTVMAGSEFTPHSGSGETLEEAFTAAIAAFSSTA